MFLNKNRILKNSISGVQREQRQMTGMTHDPCRVSTPFGGLREIGADDLARHEYIRFLRERTSSVNCDVVLLDLESGDCSDMKR